MIEFKNDENGYFAWLSQNPNGYVLNVRFDSDPDYVVLHRASCSTISSENLTPGAYTSRGFRKWCADQESDLQSAAKLEGRKDGTFSKKCSLCNK